MPKNYPSIDRLADLQQLVADFSKITRAFKLADTDRPENDVDHSYALAMTCWYLAPKIAPELSLEKIFKYALAHDIVEIYAGDTFVFDQTGAVDTKHERENQALAQLRNEWVDFTEMTDSADDYMQKTNEEAKFVKAIDKILPLIVIEQGEGVLFWNRHDITLAMEIENKVSIKISEPVAPYYESVIEWLSGRGNIPLR